MALPWISFQSFKHGLKNKYIDVQDIEVREGSRFLLRQEIFVW